MDVELVAQLLLPLIAQMRRTQDAKPPSVTAGEQLRCDQSRFDRLADANVICDQHSNDIKPQRHDHRDKLIWSWPD
jgi:hypothetical protein